VGLDYLETAERENQQGDDDQEENAHRYDPSLVLHQHWDARSARRILWL
jgi:hypothetical protein